MADNIENKPQKNNEIKKDVKATNVSPDKSKSVNAPLAKNKETKKDSPKIENKEVVAKQPTSLDSTNKKVTTAKKIEDVKTEKKSKLSVKNDGAKDLKKESTSNSQDPKKTNDSSSKNTDQNDFIEKLVSINRVAKVVKGGRRFSFAALVVVGDGNGMVGHGKGKAKEVPEAIKKATDEAKTNMIRVPLRHGKTLHHDIKGRFDSGKVYLRSAPSGTGVIAGGPMRAVFEALGIEDIVAKSVGSSNPHNMIRATFEALKSSSSPKIIAMRRGLKINDITKRRKFNEVSDNVKN